MLRSFTLQTPRQGTMKNVKSSLSLLRFLIFPVNWFNRILPEKLLRTCSRIWEPCQRSFCEDRRLLKRRGVSLLIDRFAKYLFDIAKQAETWVESAISGKAQRSLVIAGVFRWFEFSSTNFEQRQKGRTKATWRIGLTSITFGVGKEGLLIKG